MSSVLYYLDNLCEEKISKQTFYKRDETDFLNKYHMEVTIVHLKYISPL